MMARRGKSITSGEAPCPRTRFGTESRGRHIISLLAAACLIAGGLALSGCPALMVPSLAYQGYKYEKNKSSGTASSRKRSSSKSNSNDQNIE